MLRQLQPKWLLYGYIGQLLKMANREITAKCCREIIGKGNISQIFPFTCRTTPLPGLKIVHGFAATYIPNTLVMPGTFGKGGARYTQIWI
jgi:hypothetical protein